MTPTATVAAVQRAPRAGPAPVGAASLALGHAVNDSYAYILPPLLPILLTQAGITLSMGAALVAVNMLASSILQPVFGHWADQSGAGRWMVWAGVLLSGAGAAALGVVPGFAGMGLAMLAAGVGAALFHPVSAALVASAAPPSQRGFWMSAYISAGNVGLGLGPAAGRTGPGQRRPEPHLAAHRAGRHRGVIDVAPGAGPPRSPPRDHEPVVAQPSCGSTGAFSVPWWPSSRCEAGRPPPW